ncbi:hypothetical protein QCA50_020956 [Cerrena zonata]|uniref:Mtf2-like C-terminal domain-containing protein n=1 Tax=Cerrena zonata TaxID=2478898 RepID=A0AAW0FBI9_9APHY
MLSNSLGCCCRNVSTRRLLAEAPPKASPSKWTSNLSQAAVHSRRHISSRSQNQGTAASLDALFNNKVSRWPSIVGDDTSSPLSSPRPSSSSKSSTSPTPSKRRQKMTQREYVAFTNMFDMLFEAAHQPTRQLTPAIGATSKPRAGASVVELDLFDRLRQYSKNTKWASQEDDAVDRKKEAMDLCETDQQLLEWAIREVFAESQQYEENARKILESPSGSREKVPLQPLAYPHLVAELMKKFRDKYSDPHLALSIFDYARNLSSLSYVFGCTTPAYNELIETRWSCFRDLRGVCDALEEMHVNGVEMDTRTRALAERIRQEIGERNLWEEEMSAGSGEVLQMMNFIERVTAQDIKEGKEHSRGKEGKKWTKHKEQWKSYALNEDDSYEFNHWDGPR